MKASRIVLPLIALLLVTVPRRIAAQSAADSHPEVRTLKITILSTMLADDGIGEWGFAALVEADGRKILFDTGARPNTVLENARELKIDLSDVQDVILSHFHDDHTTGLMTLRREFSKSNPKALSRVHVAQGIFLERRGHNPNPMIQMKKDYEATGGVFIVHDKPEETFSRHLAQWPRSTHLPRKELSGGHRAQHRNRMGGRHRSRRSISRLQHFAWPSLALRLRPFRNHQHAAVRSRISAPGSCRRSHWGLSSLRRDRSTTHMDRLQT